jgi:hypothetical protein
VKLTDFGLACVVLGPLYRVCGKKNKKILLTKLNSHSRRYSDLRGPGNFGPARHVKEENKLGHYFRGISSSI